eukprot:gene5362-6691_t
MLIKEYRIFLPMNVDEYKLAQSYMVARKTHESTQNGDGVDILANEPYTNDEGIKGTYTHKIFNLRRSLPKFASAILPKSALKIEEQSWNCYPHTKTIYSCPFFGEKFQLFIESIHKNGVEEDNNVFNLDKKTLKQRKVDVIDIAYDKVDPKDYVREEDPKLFHSSKSNRGPLNSPDWRKKVNPGMICYKLVSVNFSYWGFQDRVENLVHNNGMRDIFLKAHRSLFCWMDECKSKNEHSINLDRVPPQISAGNPSVSNSQKLYTMDPRVLNVMH